MNFGMNDRKGAFGEVESIKTSKVRIKRDRALVVYGICIFIIAVIIFIIFGDFHKELLFYIPFNYFSDLTTTVNSNKKMFLQGYPILFGILAFGLYIVFCIVSQKLYKPKFILFKLFVLPMKAIGVMLNKMLQIPDDLEHKIGFESGWFEKLDKNFFNQVVTQQDGYKRAKNLKIFYDLPYIFGNTACNNIKRLFISDDSFNDLFKILEGYLQDGLYDELWIGDNDIVTKEFAKNNGLEISDSKIYENFKSYMIRKGYQNIKNTTTNITEKVLVSQDVVVFSRNALKIFLQIHSIKFYKHLAERILVAKQFEFNPMTPKLISLLRNDIGFLSKLKRYYNEQQQELFLKTFDDGIESLLTKQETKSMLFEMFMADFMLITFKMVVERFMGIPAGLLVSKIADYDTRMILEIYQRRVLVKIVPTKNDGSTAILNSDNYTNLFIHLLNSYFDISEYGFFQELQSKFNTDIHEIPTKESE